MVSLKLVRADEPRRLVGALNRLWCFKSGAVQQVPEDVADVCLQMKYRDGMPIFEAVTDGTDRGEPMPGVDSTSGETWEATFAQVAPVELPPTMPIKQNEEIENALGIQLTWDAWQRLSLQQ